jgi:hypothetical protein
MSEPLDPPDEVLKAIGCDPGDEPMDVFIRSQTDKRNAALMALLCAALGTGFFVLWIFVGAHDSTRRSQLGSYGIGAVGLVMGLFGAWSLVTGYRKTADLVYLYEWGLACRTPASGWRAGRWVDAVAIYRKQLQAYGEFRIEFTTGTTVECASGLQDYDALAEQAQRFVHRTLLPRMRAQLADGHPLKFGPIVLTQHEFTVKGAAHASSCRVPLAQFREAIIVHGCLMVNGRIAGLDGSMIPLFEIPNYTVLIALLPVVPTNWNPAAYE